MASFDGVNYSLRPSKAIVRQLVFDGVRTLREVMTQTGMAYVGLGSVWFIDFVMAHKILGIKHMLSMEADDVGFERARFNAPFATVEVVHDHTSNVLPTLDRHETIGKVPWLVWLDVDYGVDIDLADDIRTVIEKAPTNSVLVVTFSGKTDYYGDTMKQSEKEEDKESDLQRLWDSRKEALEQSFGTLVPDDLPNKAVQNKNLAKTLAGFTTQLMTSSAVRATRDVTFVPAIELVYKDSASMITVGGALVSAEKADEVLARVSKSDWACMPSEQIVAPHLTMREAAALQTLLPCEPPLDRETVRRRLGFDLEDVQLKAFREYYRQYPSFAQLLG